MEKTFEELIEEQIGIKENYTFNELLSAMEFVREATIEECFDIVIDEYIPNARIMSLPKDRIYQFEKPKDAK